MKELLLERVIRFPLDRVYEAFAVPEINRQWIAPEGYTCTELDYDLRVGGRTTGTFVSAEGVTSSWIGTYTVVEPHACLEYTFDLEAMGHQLEGLTNRIEFEAVDGGTLVRVFLDTELADLRSGAVIGWNQSLDHLENLLSA